MWRLTHNSIPSANNLFRRGINVDQKCHICGFSEESTTHVFLKCWWAKSFWSELKVLHFWEQHSFEKIDKWVWFCINSFSIDTLIISVIGSYMIWKNRNMITRQKKALDIAQTFAFVKCRARYFTNLIFKFTVLEGNNLSIWQPPKPEFLKFSCDASWINLLKRAGIGCVVRDQNGVILGSGALIHEKVYSSLDAEGLALL